MTVLIVLMTFALFIAADALVRAVSRRQAELRTRRQRAAALETLVRIEFTHEAPSLKRAEVPAPAKRIIACARRWSLPALGRGICVSFLRTSGAR